MEKNSTTGASKNMVRAKGLARIFECSVSNVWNWRNDGIIKSYRVGQTVLFDVDECIADFKKASIQQKEGA
tara:strand:- start:195 stop:407 length:213 start_codon:yes stop_codon:yes gene_type:complete